MYSATINELNKTKKETVAIVVLLDFKKMQRRIENPVKHLTWRVLQN